MSTMKTKQRSHGWLSLLHMAHASSKGAGVGKKKDKFRVVIGNPGKVAALTKRGPIWGFRDTEYSRKKLPRYGIFEENVIGIQDIEK